MPNPLQLREFDPEFLSSFQRGLVEVLGVTDKAQLPTVFKLPVAVALTDDIVERLCARYDIQSGSDRAKHVAAAIDRYRRRAQYHYAILKGEAKYDLDMKKSAEITDREREDWQRRFDHLKRQQKIGNRKAQLTPIQRQFSRL